MHGEWVFDNGQGEPEMCRVVQKDGDNVQVRFPDGHKRWTHIADVYKPVRQGARQLVGV